MNILSHSTQATQFEISTPIDSKEQIWLKKNSQILTTNQDGNISGILPPGDYRFIIQTTQQTHTFNLSLRSEEDVQIITSLFADGSTPSMEIESSHNALKLPTDNQTKTAKKILGNGFIHVNVTSGQQIAIEKAHIIVSGLNQNFKTDANGTLKATLPAGTYTLSVFHSGFNTKTENNVVISKDQEKLLNITLTPIGHELPEYIVLEPYIQGSVLSAIEEQRTSLQVASVLSAEQFKKSGDSDTASALKRVSGLTLIGGQFIFIRGLGERYSSTLINGAAIPSPDPTRRVIPMSLFPTSLIDSLLVQKAFSPDRPGEFAGGVVELRTLATPDDFFFNFNATGGINSQSSFQDGLTYKGSGHDFLGFDDGTRALPESIAEATKNGPLSQSTVFNPNGLTPSEIEVLAEDLSDVWDITTKKNPPDSSLQASIGDAFTFGDFSLGYVAAGGWKQKFRNQDEIVREGAFSGNDSANELRLTKDFKVQRSWQQVELNGYGGVELNYNEQHQLFAKAMYLRQAIDEASISQGDIDQEVTQLRRFKLWYYSNQLFMYQIGGAHLFESANNLKFDWLYTDATAEREEPKTRDYRFDADTNGDFFFSRRADSNQTSFSDLQDTDKSWRVDVELPITINEDFEFSLVSGFIEQQKERNANIKRFVFFPAGPNGRDQEVLSQPSLEDILTPENIGADGFLIRDSTRPTDSYLATQELLSYYGMINTKLFNRLQLSGGMRWENNQQFVKTFQSVGNQNQPVETRIDKTDALPAFSSMLSLADTLQLRASFSQTISRPDFRELSPAPFTDPNTNQESTGNPELVQTDITNVDTRLEYYPSDHENIMAGFFYKTLDNPIEQVSLPGVSLQTFQNTKAAELWGFEFEVLKDLDFIDQSLADFEIALNYTWSTSEVELNKENLVVQTSNNRPLQGHSEHIFNARLGYDNPDWGTQVNLMYGIASERIIAVGLLGAPDKFEQPFSQLDLAIQQKVNDWLSINLGLRNLIDDTFLVTQGGIITRQFKRGREFTLSLKLSL
ncbi:MAG: TonB-dependent receptor [Methyloprofundus sp.]|nr:TonB-dependent receptor [Methyloprofundus sp.]